MSTPDSSNQQTPGTPVRFSYVRIVTARIQAAELGNNPAYADNWRHDMPTADVNGRLIMAGGGVHHSAYHNHDRTDATVIRLCSHPTLGRFYRQGGVFE